MTNSAPARAGALPAAGRYSETALSGIYEISKIVTSPASLKVMLNNVVSVMSSFLDMRLATLALLDDEGDPEINVSASTEHGMAGGEDAEIPIAVIDQIAATATPLAVQNCALHPLFAGWKRLGRVDPGYVQTFIGVPIRVDNKVAGTLAIERVWKGTMDVRIDHDVRFLTMVASLVGQALKVHRVVAEDRERLIFEQHRLAKQLATLRASEISPPTLSGILGKSPALRAVTEQIEQVAKSNAPALIRGETGTGKELFARAIHEQSQRKGKPFIAVNCAALPEGVIESELFGHEKGAFTGAIATRKGRFEMAHGGTIFLDEIGDIDANVQPKLLKVVEEKKFRRMGDVRDRFIDVRLIAATHQDLRRLIETKVFRSDLYFRISTVPLVIPPLRERQDDIPFVAQSLLRRICSDMARPGAELSTKAVERLRSYYWPGNIRELRNVLERALLFTDRPVLEAGDLAFETSPVHPSDSYKPDWTLEELERFHISAAFSGENQNVEKTARRLGITKSTLYQKLKALHLT